MLIFLRKIRKSLIESGSTRKYVLYAIGEIALVVIGILIALQINNWNDQLISKRIEQKLLDGIKEELLVNKNQLEDVILNHEVAVDCSRKVLELYHHDIQTLDSEVVDSLVDGIISYWTFNPRLGFIKSIISSGRLGHIKNERLLTLLSQFEDQVHDATEGQDWAIDLWKVALASFSEITYQQLLIRG